MSRLRVEQDALHDERALVGAVAPVGVEAVARADPRRRPASSGVTSTASGPPGAAGNDERRALDDARAAAEHVGVLRCGPSRLGRPLGIARRCARPPRAAARPSAARGTCTASRSPRTASARSSTCRRGAARRRECRAARARRPGRIPQERSRVPPVTLGRDRRAPRRRRAASRASGPVCAKRRVSNSTRPWRRMYWRGSSKAGIEPSNTRSSSRPCSFGPARTRTRRSALEHLDPERADRGVHAVAEARATRAAPGARARAAPARRRPAPRGSGTGRGPMIMQSSPRRACRLK